MKSNDSTKPAASIPEKTKAVSKRTTKAVEAAPATPRARKPKAAVPSAASVEKTAVPLPAILFEGDAPTPPAASGPGERYSLGATAPHHDFGFEALGELPDAYGTQRLLLTA